MTGINQAGRFFSITMVGMLAGICWTGAPERSPLTRASSCLMLWSSGDDRASSQCTVER